MKKYLFKILHVKRKNISMYPNKEKILFFYYIKIIKFLYYYYLLKWTFEKVE